MKIKVLAIAPYPGLADLIQNTVRKDPMIELDVEIADLEQSLPIVQRAEQQGYDVILSRGGTASLIRQHVSLPVVDIPVSGYDILRVLTLIKDSNSKIAIIGFPNICQGADTVSSLLDFEVPLYSVEHASEVPSILQKAFENGAEIILGDVITVQTSRDMGYHGILITSGRESVEEALQEVKRVFDVFLAGRQEVGYFKRLMEGASCGIASITSEGVIEYVNQAAADYLGGKKDWLVKQSLSDISPEIQSLTEALIRTEESRADAVIMLGDKAVKVQCLIEPDLQKPRISLYLDKIENHAWMQDLSRNIVHKPASFTQILGSSEAIRKVVRKASGLAKSDGNILITGEVGTEMAQFAEAIHSASAHHKKCFYRFSCGADAERLERELFGTETGAGLLESVAEGTVYLEQIEQLPLGLQSKLAAAITGIKARILSSATAFPSELINEKIMLPELVHWLSQFQIMLPPLRTRSEDIEEIARVVIAAHNSEQGKQIVGIREPVLELLRSHDWPGNLLELRNVLKEMLVLTKGHYVEIKDAEAVWERYSSPSVTNPANLNIDGTWEEIERRILLRVLQEEGMNQSRAAKRLGINRSTLWRKLQ